MLLGHLVIVHIHPSPPNAPCNNQWRRMEGWLEIKERQIDLQCQVENEVVTKHCGGEEAGEREEERGLDVSYFHFVECEMNSQFIKWGVK